MKPIPKAPSFDDYKDWACSEAFREEVKQHLLREGSFFPVVEIDIDTVVRALGELGYIQWEE